MIQELIMDLSQDQIVGEEVIEVDFQEEVAVEDFHEEEIEVDFQEGVAVEVEQEAVEDLQEQEILVGFQKEEIEVVVGVVNLVEVEVAVQKEEEEEVAVAEEEGEFLLEIKYYHQIRVWFDN